jgi:hypothetical protein
MFLHTSCALWQSAWSVVGVGIRLALDVGAHRNKMYSETPTVHDELWRRAFWYISRDHPTEPGVNALSGYLWFLIGKPHP